MPFMSPHISEEALVLSLHVCCDLACCVASCSGSVLIADVEEKTEISCLFSSVEVEIC